jgi:hypothetical protein
VAHTCNPSYPGGKIRRIVVRSQLGQIVVEILSQKKPFTKIRLVERLKVKVLSSNTSTAKKDFPR